MNFTPLNLQSFFPNNNFFLKIKKKLSYIFVSSFFISFLILSFVIFIFSLFGFKPQPISTKANQIKKEIITFKYHEIEKIPFIVNNINSFSTNGRKYFEDLKKQNPRIKEEDLTSEINKQIFIYYFFSPDKSFPSDYFNLVKKNESLISQYQQKIKKYTGYYLKIRFQGYYGERDKEIKNIFGNQNLRKLAQNKIEDLIKNNPHPSSLFPILNDDQNISQLNNNESAIDYFENNSFEEPLFDDPDFYRYLENAPLNQYSPIYVLKTNNPGNPEFEEYAFLVFFIENVSGEKIPLKYLINTKINEISYH